MSKESRKRKSSMGFGEGMMWMAGVLFCLVLITTAMMGGLFARYITSATGSDSARVVVFGNLTLTETGDFVAIGDKRTAKIKIILSRRSHRDRSVKIPEPSETNKKEQRFPLLFLLSVPRGLSFYKL